jgi:hypothetical protein
LIGSGLVARSGHPELPSPTGFEGSAAWDIWSHWRFVLGYYRMWDHTEKMGLVCRTYAPNISCHASMTENDVTLSGARGTLLRTIVLAPGLRIGLGGGLSFNQVKATSIGDNGMRADLLMPYSGHIGYLARVSAQWIPPLPLPLRLNVTLNEHFVDFNTCSGTTPPQYDPFCDAAELTELGAGLSLVF